MSIENTVTQKASQSAVVLTELRKVLSQSAHNAHANGNGIDHLSIAEALFSRAPDDFITRMRTEELAALVKEATTFFESFISGTDAATVQVRNDLPSGSGRPVTTVMTACFDRPFIVDTIIETLATLGHPHRALLHPIIRINDGRRVSLTIAQLTKRLGDERCPNVESTLRQRFADVILVTNDFSEVLSQLESTANEIEKLPASQSSDIDATEAAAYLRWLGEFGFVLLGSRKWAVSTKSKQEISLDEKSDLGLFRTADNSLEKALADCSDDAHHLLNSPDIIHCAKLPVQSPVHRHVHIDVITVKVPTPNGNEIRLFAGLFTTKARSQEATQVPFVRRKFQRVLEREALTPNSHDHKEIVSIVDAMPKGELTRQSTDQLRHDLLLITNLQRRADVRVRCEMDALKRFASVLVVMPKERYNTSVRDRIQSYVEKSFKAKDRTAECSVILTDYPLAIAYFLVPNPKHLDLKESPEEFELAIAGISMSWEDMFRAALPSDQEELSDKLSLYLLQFTEAYRSAVSPQDAVNDALMLDALSPEDPLGLRLIEVPSSADLSYLKIYKQGEGFTLSAILPYLDNAGLIAVNETVTPVTNPGGEKVAIYNLLVRTTSGQTIEQAIAANIVLPGLKKVFLGTAENDRLNALLLNPGLTCEEIAVLRAITHYLWQIKASTSGHAVVSALTENPALSKLLVSYFYTKFDPAAFSDMETRKKKLATVKEEFLASLKKVAQLLHDRTLRAMLNVIDSTVRTNFFRPDAELRVAIKINPKLIEHIPLPRPFAEIFVDAPDFQGVHLRGGKVARGGIRWSDRVDDFRTEVLGLMKTQMLKNSIIIPVGAKGGFVLKKRPTDPTELSTAVREKYTRFIRSLLEVTDNLVNNKVVHPENCVIYDGDDPYFVVAADRGTATFSDTANQLSTEEFNLWLGDAFASGGSYGYDHKKYAITARGAWEAVCRHFREIGLDMDAQGFSVVGIGDMSGDVFGNGLLLSRKARLLAAFDHRHIFIDPNPDSERSFLERQRLFALPRSSWADYDAKLISKGGGVWSREMKEIAISSEAKEALGIEADILSGQELIRAVLLSPVDLLWNGGIGTYVKASTQDNAAAGDRTNDEVRVDAKDLRVKVVGEGGNLGFTQLARIEYSKIGGHINTDAVDNSGGVNMSDLEVNLKILLSSPVQRKELTFETRNTLLTQLAEDVSEKVLSKNRIQSLVLSLGVRKSRKSLGYYRALTLALEKEGLLDRKGEFLPDEETFQRRIQLKAGLTRPELAVLMGYAKMSLFNTLIDSELLGDKSLEHYLVDYFPVALQERFPDDISNHPLRREIIATQVANIVVEKMGATFVHRAAEETGLKRINVIKCFLAADAVVCGDKLLAALASLDKPHTSRLYHTVLLKLSAAVDGMSRWFLEHQVGHSPLSETVDRYKPAFKLLSEEAESLASQMERTRLRENNRQLIMSGMPRELASALTATAYATSFLDITEITFILAGQGNKIELRDVAKLYSHLAAALNLRILLEQASEIDSTDKWETVAIRALTADLRRSVARLTRAVIEEQHGATLTDMDKYLQERKDIIDRLRSTIQEFSSRPMTIPGLLAITNQLFALSRNAM